MEKIKLTQKDIEKVIPPKDKKEAMQETERFEREFEKNRKELEEMFEELQKMIEELQKKEESE